MATTIQVLLLLTFFTFIGIIFSNLKPGIKKALTFVTLTVFTILIFANVSYTIHGNEGGPHTTTIYVMPSSSITDATIYPIDGKMVLVKVTISAFSTRTETFQTETTFMITSGKFTMRLSGTDYVGDAFTNPILMVHYNQGNLTWINVTNYSGSLTPFKITFITNYIIQQPNGFVYVITEAYMDYSNYTLG